MALGKQEQLDRIKKLERKALRMFKEKGPKYDGAQVNKWLEQVIKWEDLYEKRYGRNPGKYD